MKCHQLEPSFSLRLAIENILSVGDKKWISEETFQIGELLVWKVKLPKYFSVRFFVLDLVNCNKGILFVSCSLHVSVETQLH